MCVCVLLGCQIDTIVNTAKDKDIDLIILQEEHNLLDKLTHHSNRDRLAKKSDVPIMLYKK